MTVTNYKNIKYVAEILQDSYRVDELVGCGATGPVYKCWDKAFERFVALKIFPHESGEYEHTALLEYIRKDIQHSNLIRIFSGDYLRHYFYYDMEFIDGETLKHKIEKQGKLPPDMAEKYLTMILDGLGHLHDNELLHRDIKPANIMVRRNGQLVICDIGLVKKQNTNSTVSQAGTEGYRPNDKKASWQSDIYAVGKTFGEMLTGRLLDYSEIDKCPDLSEKHKRIIKKAIEGNSDDRFSSANKFKKELLSSPPGISRRGVEDKPLKYATRPQPVSLVDITAPVDNRVENDPSKKNKIWWTMLIVAIVAVYFALQSSFFKLDDKKSSINENRISHAKNDNTQSGNISSQNIDLNLPMALIPSGTFMMGSPDSGNDATANEKPQHQVTISKSFQMSKHEVTNAQYCVFLNDGQGAHYYASMSITNSGGTYAPATGKENFPVVYVTWDDAKAFCDWLTAKTAQTYRLPTEAEWEYACKAGTTTKYYWGDTPDTAKANYNFSVGAPQAVGTYSANPWGLYDMSGNVEEWCADWYGNYGSGSATDPTGPSSGSTRILRGGGFDDSNHYIRCAGRSSTNADNRNSGFGIRVVKGAIPTEVTEDRLVAHWKFDENGGTIAGDASGNNNIGELHGGNWVAGVKGNAISLNGTSDFVEVQDSKSLNLTTSGTIALWVKIDRGYVKSGCGPGLVSKGEGTAVGKVAYDLALDSGNQYEGYVHDGSYTDAAKATPVFERWQFLVFTWDSTRIKLYLDGNLIQEKKQVGKGPFVNTFKLYMGKRYYESQAVWGYFKGLLDEVRIYKYAMEASDIQRLYNQEKPALP